MRNKEAYREKLEAQMREWSAKIDLLKARADQAKAEAKIEYSKGIEDLLRRKEALQAKISDLQHASDAAWQDIKAGTERARQPTSAMPCRGRSRSLNRKRVDLLTVKDQADLRHRINP